MIVNYDIKEVIKELILMNVHISFFEKGIAKSGITCCDNIYSNYKRSI